MTVLITLLTIILFLAAVVIPAGRYHNIIITVVVEIVSYVIGRTAKYKWRNGLKAFQNQSPIFKTIIKHKNIPT